MAVDLKAATDQIASLKEAQSRLATQVCITRLSDLPVLRRRQYFFRAVNQNYCPGSSSYANLYRTYLKNICFYFLISTKMKISHLERHQPWKFLKVFDKIGRIRSRI
jgi:hypothetical protein